MTNIENHVRFVAVFCYDVTLKKRLISFFKGLTMDKVNKKASLQPLHFNDIIDTENLDMGSSFADLSYDDMYARASILNCSNKSLNDISSFNNRSLIYVAFGGFENVERLVGHLDSELLFRKVIKIIKDFLGEKAKTYNTMIGHGLIFTLPQLNDYLLKKKLIHIVSFFSDPICLNKETHSISARIGVYKATEKVVSFKEALRNARFALPKDDGHISFYSNNVEDHNQIRLFLQDKLEYAIDNNEFNLLYQGVHNAQSGNLIGVEALLRWRDFLDDDINPQEFMPVANKSARIVEINLYVIRKTLSDFKSWLNKDIASDSFKVWINVSIHQLKMGFVSQLIRELEYFNLNPRNFLIEIQESSLINNFESCMDDLIRLSSLDIGLTIDSFGSDLGCLKLINDGYCQYIKIDREFVSDVNSDKLKENFVKCLVKLANNTNVGVIAVGVENQSQKDALFHCGCDLAQGYFYSKPVESEKIGLLASGV